MLHLEDNKIRVLKGFEFEHLMHLRELYLQNNLISFIGNLTLLPLKSLEILRLEGNRLVTFPVWQVTLNTRLVELSLAGNPWSCRCKFLRELAAWVSDPSHRVIDGNDVWCSDNDNSPLYRRRLDMNETEVCSDYYEQTGMIESILVSEYTPMIISSLSALLLLVIIAVLLFIFRKQVREWAYTKSTLRFITKGESADDKERLYDAYVCYSPKDEEFVTRSVCLELEHSGLRLCLHHRDIPCLRAGSTVMLEAAEASRRVVLVLTRNFMQTEWTRYEFRAAVRDTLRGRSDRLVVIQAGPVEGEIEADVELKGHLRPASVVRWGEKRFWEKLRKAMPHSSQPPLRCKTLSLYKRNVNTYTMEDRAEKDTRSLRVHRAHHHPLFKDDMPPAYCTSPLRDSREGSSPNPSPRLTMNRGYQDHHHHSAAAVANNHHHYHLTQEGSLNPLSEGGRRPVSEHIYSSIDSDYSTLERNAAWRQQHHQQQQQQQPSQAYLV